MEPRKINKKLRITLNIAMSVLVFALVLSFFFPAIKVTSKGISEVPQDFLLFDYIYSKDPWLIISFIFSCATIFSGVALIIVTALEVVGLIKHNKYKDIVGIVTIVVSIMALVFTLIYCGINTPYSTNNDVTSLKFIPYLGMYFIYLCGFFAGILALLDSPVLRSEDVVTKQVLETPETKENEVNENKN